MPVTGLGEVGGGSNTPLPVLRKPEWIVTLPVVCDTAYLSFDTELPEWVLKLCLVASERNSVQVRTALNNYEKADHERENMGAWECRGGSLKGFSAYTHTLTGTGPWDGVRIMIGQPREVGENQTRHRIMLMLGAEVLWKAAGQGLGLYLAATSLMAELLKPGVNPPILLGLPRDEDVKPSRIDVCVDHWGKEWRLDDLYAFSTRTKCRGIFDRNVIQAEAGDDGEAAREQGWTFTGPAGATYYLGKRGAAARFLRIYDKTAEALASGKAGWLEPIWRKYGWDGSERVWRAEVEHGSEWLRGHGCASLADCRTIERDLWEHYTRESVRHVNRRSCRYLRNCHTSKAWQCLQSAAITQPGGCWEWTPRPETQGFDETALVKQAAGCMRAIGRHALPAMKSAAPAGQAGIWADDGIGREQAEERVLNEVLERVRKRMLADLAEARAKGDTSICA